MIGVVLAATLTLPGPAATRTAVVPVAVTYVVAPGDSLWAIAGRRLGDPREWPALYAANERVIGGDPGHIYPGQLLTLRPPREGQARDRDPGRAGTAPSVRPAARPVLSGAGRAASPRGGTLGCGGLEALWVSAGGPPGAAVTAAGVAMAESGGRQYATGEAGERGYWQVHPDHGALSTYDPWGNARAAVILSAGGTDWSAWTTFTSGLYAGRCLPDRPQAEGYRHGAGR